MTSLQVKSTPIEAVVELWCCTQPPPLTSGLWQGGVAPVQGVREVTLQNALLEAMLAAHLAPMVDLSLQRPVARLAQMSGGASAA